MPFTLPLRDMGFAGDYAHLSCLTRERRKCINEALAESDTEDSQ